MFSIKKLLSSKTKEVVEISNSDNVVIFKIEALGSYEPCFYKPSILVFKAKSLKIENMIYSEISNVKAENKYNSINEIYDDLSDLSGSLNYQNVKNFLSIWSFGVVDFHLLEENHHNCDCCGSYETIRYKLKNKETKTTVFFQNDNHFYSGYEPSPYDLLDFILNGTCKTEFSKDD